MNYHLQLTFQRFYISQAELSTLTEQHATILKKYERLEEEVGRLSGLMEKVMTSPQAVTSQHDSRPVLGNAKVSASGAAMVPLSGTSAAGSNAHDCVQEFERRLATMER